jgi:hypothetical protein
VTLSRSKKSEAANLEKSSKCSKKEVTNCMPSKNPSDSKGRNIGKRFVSLSRSGLHSERRPDPRFLSFVAKKHTNFLFC